MVLWAPCCDTHLSLLVSQHHPTGDFMLLQGPSYDADHGQLHSQGLLMLPVTARDMFCFRIGAHMARAAYEAVLRRPQ